MTVTLSSEIEEIVVEKVRTGNYQSVDAVINESIRLLVAKEKGTQALRREIMRGFESIERGQFVEFSTDEELDAFSDELIRLAKERAENANK